MSLTVTPRELCSFYGIRTALDGRYVYSLSSLISTWHSHYYMQEEEKDPAWNRTLCSTYPAAAP